MTPEPIDLARLKVEAAVLSEFLARREPFPGDVRRIPSAGRFANPRPEAEIGVYRHPDSRKLATADASLLARFHEAGLPSPVFFAAGPRAELAFDPATVRAAIVTTGGLAPGLNSVIHAIVDRHYSGYHLNTGAGGAVLGVYEGFRGFLDLANHETHLDPGTTREWLPLGGCQLGISRYRHPEAEGGFPRLIEVITDNLERHEIDIVYCIGGDGTQTAAHALAEANPDRVVMGVPKTMDNDLLWIWESFGFDTSVSEATRAINTLHFEAQSTRRVCIIKFFGAASGFVVANAALASGKADLVLVPETLLRLNEEQFDEHWSELMEHVRRRVLAKRKTPHAVIVVAEGVERVLAQRGFRVAGEPVRLDEGGSSSNLIPLLQRELGERVVRSDGRPMRTFVNEPRHYIRSVPANAHDQIYCERLGALAVDNALAGYTDCMVSQWLTESVLVPLSLVTTGKKSIPPTGMFWKLVVNSTGQPQAPSGSASG